MAPSPAAFALARRLLVLEGGSGKTATGNSRRSTKRDARSDPSARVCRKLQANLTAFAGSAGFRSLLARALTLARPQEPALADVQVLEDGSLAGLAELGGSSKAGAAGERLVAQLLDLLIVLIGEPLTLQLVRSAWPAVTSSALRSRGKGRE